MSIIVAIPSKGRLKDRSVEIFSEAGMPIELAQDNRTYRGEVPAMPEVEIAFMSASEIARELVAGKIHLGITGEDLARETVADADAVMDIGVKLQFGHADVVVAVPEAWIDVDTMADLDDVAAEFRQRHGRRLRIATKYWQLTQNFFAGHGIAVYRIVESLGATEGAPAAGTADVIVDITSTGSTLRANKLKVLSDGIILKSQARLIRSRTSQADIDQISAIETLVSRIAKSLRATSGK